MKKLLLATTALLALSLPAKAELVLRGGTPTTAFTDVKGAGFGDIHRMLTLQTSGSESGGILANGTITGNPSTGGDKTAVFTFGQLGWTSPSNVGVFFDADQEGQTGITLQKFTVTVNNGSTILGTFSTAAPITFTAADLALEPGNGTGGFFFALTPAEQSEFAAFFLLPGFQNFVVASSATLGCPTGSPAGCLVSNDGPDSFFAVNQASIGAVPEASTWAMMIIGFLGVGAIGMRRRAGSRSFRFI